MAHFHHFSIAIKINEFFGHFRQNAKVIALLFGQKWLIFITFQSAIKINEFQFWSFSAKYQGYSLTFWPTMAPSLFNLQSKSMNVNRQNTKVIALLFGQKWLIFITFLNEFQFWSFVGKIPRLYPYFLAKNGSFSSLFNLQSKSMISILVIFWQNTKVITLVLATNGSFSSLFNLQSKSMNFNESFLAKYQGYSLGILATNGSIEIHWSFQLQLKINEFQVSHLSAKIPRL